MSNEIKRRHWAYLQIDMSPAKVELALELNYHEKLLADLSTNPESDFYQKLALIARYCDVIVDGYYTDEEVDRLCNILTSKLQRKRSIIVLPTSARIH